MLKSTPLLTAVIALTALASTAQSPAISQGDAPLTPGSAAPPFRTTTVDGGRVSLASLRGHVVLLDFWATWCGACRMATPTLERLHNQFNTRGLRVVGIDLDDRSTVGDVRPFIKAHGITYTVAADPDIDVDIARKYNATGLPTQYLIDKKGVIRWSQAGFDPSEGAALSAKIKKLLAEK